MRTDSKETHKVRVIMAFLWLQGINETWANGNCRSSCVCKYIYVYIFVYGIMTLSPSVYVRTD